MSQLASFYLINVSQLPALAAQPAPATVKKLFRKKFIDPYWDYLEAHSLPLECNTGFLGGIFSNIILFLEAYKQLDLPGGLYKEFAEAITATRGTSTFILTNEHKKQFERIGAISAEECRAANIEFEGDGSDENVQLFQEGLAVLGCVFEQMADEEQVVIMAIG